MPVLTERPQPQVPHAPPRRGHLLIVDDDPMTVDLPVSLLRDDERFPVCVAYSADQALALAAADPPVAALLDVSLPGAEIVETVARLRLISGFSRLPVALCSGHEWLDALAAATGAVAALRKPFNLDAVVRVAERYVQRATA
jgi:CheY-like chemotaxis protein